MRQVLIVDDGAAPLLSLLRTQLQSCQNRFAILTANSASEAFDILGAQKIDLVLSVWGPSFIDAFLLEISEASSALSILVMVPASACTLANEIRIFYRCDTMELDAPVEEIVGKISSMLQIPDDDGFLTGIVLASFLKKIHKRGETALLKVLAQDGRSGLVFIQNGEVWDASFGILKGKKALFALLSGENLRFKFLKVPERKIRRNIYKSLVELLESHASGENSDEEEDFSMPPTDMSSTGTDGEVSPADVQILFSDEDPESRPAKEKESSFVPENMDLDAEEVLALELEEAEPPLYLEDKNFEGLDDWIREVDAVPGDDVPLPTMNGHAADVSAEKMPEAAVTRHEGSAVSFPSPGESKGDTPKFFLDEEKSEEVRKALFRLREIEGFLAVGLFLPDGTMLSQLNNSTTDLNAFGPVANDILLKVQQATNLLGFGAGQAVHIDAPKAHIIVRCLDEARDSDAGAEGGAHIHMILIMEKEKNLGMGKLRLASVILEIAPLFRQRAKS